jgi:hypothetical protein
MQFIYLFTLFLVVLTVCCCLSSSGTYMQEALEIICRKRKLNPNDYALLLDKDKDNRLIPLDRTVQSLEGTNELVLVKRSMLPQLGATDVGKTTDPNGDRSFYFFFCS